MPRATRPEFRRIYLAYDEAGDWDQGS